MSVPNKDLEIAVMADPFDPYRERVRVSHKPTGVMVSVSHLRTREENFKLAVTLIELAIGV
jgi:hypothetical protein